MARCGRIVAIMFFITVARWEIIDSPPYYDFAIGIWPEAQFLADTNFDYHRLRYEENHSLDVQGGPRSYMTSVVPSLLALLLQRWPGSVVPLITYHIVIFFCAAVSLALLYELMVSRTGAWIATLICLAAATTPVFCVQMDMTGMEMPLVVAMLVAVFLLSRKSYSAAALTTLLAFLIKPTGLVATLALTAVLAVLVLDRRRRWHHWLGLGVAIAVLILEVRILRWGASIHAQIAAGPPFSMTLVWTPDLLLVTGIAALVWLLYVGRLLFLHGNVGENSNWRDRLTHLAEAEGCVLFAGAFVAGVFLASDSVRFIPRYLACTVPFVYLSLALTAVHIAWGKPALSVGLLLVIGFNLANWNGAFYPDPEAMVAKHLGPPGDRLAREGSFLERSHEYLADHRQNQALIRYLSTHCQNDAIVVGIPFAYFLAFPCMRYVDTPLPAYVINGFVDAAPHFRDVVDLLADVPKEPVFVVTRNGFYHDATLFQIPAPQAEDEILWHELGDGPFAYRKWGRVANVDKNDRQMWYLEHLWPTESFAAKSFLNMRANRWKSSRRNGSCSSTEIKEQLWRLELAALAVDVGMEDLATDLYYAAARAFPNEWETVYERLPWHSPGGIQERKLNRALNALPKDKEHLRKAARLCRKHDSCLRASEYLLVDLEQRIPRLHQRRLDTRNIHVSGHSASKDLQRLMENCRRAPMSPHAQCKLGVAMSQMGKWQEAVNHLQRAVELAPTYATAYDQLGVVRWRTGNHKGAIDAFEQAVLAEPFHSDAINHLRCALVLSRAKSGGESTPVKGL